EKKREIGNNLYTKGDYSGAISSYQKAIKYLSSSVSEEVQSLQMKCWNNMAAAQLKIKAYSAAEKSCSQVLQVDPENVLAGKGETENALVYIKKADQLDPGNKV
ncbi:Peptidyl-prolyl cis-trans isomerase FKBP8, partial [Acropora cervicornis]